jgi:hypothetical protein
MRKKLSIFVVCLFLSCGHHLQKRDHKFTVNLCKYKPGSCNCGLYAEGYLSFGMGALGSDLYSVYLTDSSHFRVYIGDFDEENERFEYDCSVDSVYVEKRTNKGYARDDWRTYKVLDKKFYNLKDLKRGNVFE